MAPISRHGANTGELDFDSYRVLMRCAGKGAPTVVLDGNLHGASADWASVRAEVSRFTRVCTYDRQGSPPLPLTSARIVDDLRPLVRETAAEGPYILVGWAFGAYTMRLYASRFPDEVCGLVLVDPLHEDFFRRYRTILPPAEADTLDPLQDFRYQLAGGYRYLMDMEASAEEVRSAPAPGADLPIVVVSRGDPDWPIGLSPELLWSLEHAWQAMQRELLTLSANSVQMIAQHSGHLVQHDRPDVVVDAIRLVVEAARRGRPLRP